jgi:CBS domain-containing protein
MIKADKLITCGPEDSLEELRATGVFNRISGLPVVRNDGVLLGIISHKDLNKPGTRVADVMTSSPIAARPSDTSSAAACLMLKYKVSFWAYNGNMRMKLGMFFWCALPFSWQLPTERLQTSRIFLLLFSQVHRIPVVDKQKKCVGIVTRSDVFTALAVDAGVNTNVMEPNMLDMWGRHFFGKVHVHEENLQINGWTKS